MMHGVLLIGLVGALALPALAHAQGSSEPGPQLSDEVRAELRRLNTDGRAHADAGRHALAFDAFMVLHAAMQRHGLPRASVALWNAGLALTNVAGRERDARETLQRFLDDSTGLAGETDVAEFRSNALARITELDARLPSVEETAQPAGVAAPPPRGGSVSPVGPVVLGVGVLTLGLGAVFGALALTYDSDLFGRCGGSTECLDTPDDRARYDDMRTFAVAADALLVAGGLIAIAGVVLTFVLTEGGSESSDARARLHIGPTRLSIEGDF